VVVGSAIDDNSRADMPGGVVRAYNARTGRLAWKWEPLPPNDNSKSSDTQNPNDNGPQRATKIWRTGAGNAWTGMAVDAERGLVFVPTGSASPDYYGGLRLGDDKWADSIVALRAKTGEMAWGFQLVHHDLWDYDTASPPLLATVKHDGKDVPVVIQGNKTGFIYVLNRDTGVPVFPVEEKPVPQSDVPGEVTSPTQPFPSAPPALVPQSIVASDAWGVTDEDRDYCRQYLSGLRDEGIFTPPSLKGTLTIPGNVGGMNWSGSAYDPVHGWLLVNTNNLPAYVRMIPRDKFDEESDANVEHGEYADQYGTPYGMVRTFIFAKAHRLPCVAPPWGTLAAVDMNAGTIKWQVPLGSLSPAKAIVPKGAQLPTVGQPPFVVTRTYRAAHNIGHFRFVECSRLRDGRPDGDVTPYEPVFFPFDPDLDDDDDLRRRPVRRSDGGPDVEERYVVTPSGAVEVTLTTRPERLTRTFRLARHDLATA